VAEYDLVSDTQLCASEVQGACLEAGISERTYREARRELGVVSERTGFGAGGQHVLRISGSGAQREEV
jgi:hypothetical protein